MNWRQAKKRYPHLKPYADNDFDGLINCRDCKPFDPSRDGILKRAIGIVTRGKYGQTKEEYRKERREKKIRKFVSSPEQKVMSQLPGQRTAYERFKEQEKRKASRRRLVLRRIKKAPKRYIRTVSAVRKRVSPGIERLGTRTKRVQGAEVIRRAIGPSTSTVGTTGTKRGRGRPKMSYKHTDPRTGRPIKATDYYKVKKSMEREQKYKQEMLAQQAELIKRMRMARAGITPAEAEILRKQQEAAAYQQITERRFKT